MRIWRLLLAGMVAAQPVLLSAAGAQERPDFSGVWTWIVVPGQSPLASRAPPPVLPLRPEAKAKVDAYKALTGPAGDTPGGYCLGTGMPGSMIGSGGYPMEIVQSPSKFLVIYEAHSETRRFYVDDMLADEDKIEERNGHSSAHWDGDVLVVETDHLKEQVDQQYAHSANARIVERYRLGSDESGQKLLIADWEMIDPDFYTAPVNGQKRWAFMPEGRVMNYECNEPLWEERLAELRSQAGGDASGGN